MRKKLGIKEGTRIQIELNEDAKEIVSDRSRVSMSAGLAASSKGRDFTKDYHGRKDKEREL